MSRGATVAVVGAGIAGLTAALSFARKGFAVDIVEQRPQIEMIGAGLQLSPNATSILRTLGLLPRLERVWTEPGSIDLIDGASLRNLASIPSGAFARERWRAPYAVLRRADLQSVLYETAGAHPLCRFHFGTSVEAATAADLGVITGIAPMLVVCADGVWSKTRQTIGGGAKARFSGLVACRMTARVNAASPLFEPARVMAFLGAGAHLVAYPVTADTINLVAITRGDDPGRSWGTTPPDALAFLAATFRNWHPALRDTVMQADGPALWPLYSVDAGAWHDGANRILIGDAAHAMMPFAAQGAAMAIEDGFELAAFVAAGKPLSAFAVHRFKRIARVRARGGFNRFAYHARGPVGIVRDLVLSMRSPEALAADFDWLYGYQPYDG